VRQVRGVLLEYRGRNDPGKVYSLVAGRTAIGRSADCDIVLDDHEASKQHAIIYIRGDDVSFMDVSSNGSVVDGRRVHGATATLQQGSTALLGARLYVFLYVAERTLAGLK
jgi:pSer/pThr/pTyr-binding forkhead associated (FHA) protein